MEVGHTVEYVSEHRKQFFRYAAIGAAVLAVVLGIYFYTRYQRGARQEALKAALRIQDSQVTPFSGNEFVLTFPTQDEKDKAAVKAFNEIISKYDGSDEATIAHYYLGVIYADEGKPNEAQREFQIAATGSNDNFASLAKLSLSQILAATGKQADAEKVLRGLMEKPTMMVSKETAAIALARMIGPTRPDEARKLLDPLRGERGAISRAALNALGDLH